MRIVFNLCIGVLYSLNSSLDERENTNESSFPISSPLIVNIFLAFKEEVNACPRDKQNR